MLFDSRRTGAEGFTAEDRRYRGSSFAEVRRAIFANSYYLVWGGRDEPPLPVYEVTLRRALMGVLSRKRWGFQQAAKRTVDSHADLRWGDDRKGFRRILHPNGVCLTGSWEIDETRAGTGYTGYFKAGSRGLLIARYSTCCTECRSGHYRSLSMVGKLYPTTDPDDLRQLRTASFITQEDLGGTRRDVKDAELRNAPDTTPWRRGAGTPILLLTGLVLLRADKEPTIRQLYEIAELGKPADERTSAPEFMRIVTEAAFAPAPSDDIGLDFREEILGHIYDRGNATPQRPLIFHIEVSDQGTTRGRLVQRRMIEGWKRIGRIVFRDAVASYNGDFVLHFHHPIWRNDRNDPASVARRPRV